MKEKKNMFLRYGEINNAFVDSQLLFIARVKAQKVSQQFSISGLEHYEPVPREKGT